MPHCRQIKIWLLIAGMLPAPAWADSACWPEQRLIGDTATAFYRPVLQAPDAPVPIFSKEGSFQKTLPCKDFKRVYGPCDYENSYLPVYGIYGASGLINVRLRDETPVYINPRGDERVHYISKTYGALFPAETKIYEQANINSEPAKRDIYVLRGLLQQWQVAQMQDITYSYKVLVREHNAQGSWAKVQERAVRFLDDTLEYDEGSVVLREGYVRLRDENQKIIAVIEDLACD